MKILKCMTELKDCIKIYAHMYECQESANKLFGTEYPEKIKWYVEVIKAYQQAHKTEVLQSVIAICKVSTVEVNGFAVMMFMSAAVDLMEGPQPVTESPIERLNKKYDL